MEKIKVALMTQKNYDVAQIKNAMLQGLGYLGITDTLVKTGEKVLVKPNMAFGKHHTAHICTHPAVVRALCEILSDMGAKVSIGDSPGFGGFIAAAKKSGYNEYLEGFELVEFKEKVPLHRDSNKIFKHFTVARQILEADKIINVAKFKTHGSMLLTLAVKNMFGSIVGMEKAEYHLKAGKDQLMFASYLVELFYTLSPALNVIDGIWGMEGNGPVSGTGREIGFIGMSQEATALDITCASIIGFPYEKLPTYEAAKNLGYGCTDYHEIEFPGKKPKDFLVKDYVFSIKPDMAYSRMIRIFSRLFPIKPKINHKNCRLCRVCEKICPVKTISLEKNRMKIHYAKCIQCFCCQEFCEFDAIRPHKPFLRRFFSGMAAAFALIPFMKKKRKQI